MTKQLFILRHAKSDWSNFSLPDKQRPLNDRGRRAAPKLADYLMAKLQKVKRPLDYIGCSTALRTVQTLEPLLERLKKAGQSPEIDMRDDLYLAGAETIFNQIKALPSSVGTALFIGHNPGLEMLIDYLTENRGSYDLARVERKFVTAGLCYFTLDKDSWQDSIRHGFILDGYVKPKNL